jgi:hypothetical protein
VTLGRQLRRPELPPVGARWGEAVVPETSVYRFLARERTRLFPPGLFADLFAATGRGPSMTAPAAAPPAESSVVLA